MKWRSRSKTAAALSIYFLWHSTMPDASAWFARTRPGCSRLPSKAERLSPDLGRKERRTEMAELPKELVVSMPQRQEPQPAEPDVEREVIMAAAAHLDHHRREREELKRQ